MGGSVTPGSNARLCAMLLESIRHGGPKQAFSDHDCLQEFQAVGIPVTSLKEAQKTVKPPSDKAYWNNIMAPYDAVIQSMVK